MKSYDKTLTRLILILTKLSNNEQPTVKELALEFAVGERTIQRDVYQRLAYFPIEKDKEYRLKFINDFSLESSSLGKIEMQLVYLALSMLKDNTPKVDTLTDNILSKLLLPNFSSPYFIEKEFFEVFDPELEPAKSIIEAIEKRRVVLIKYKQNRPIDEILNHVHSGWFEDGNPFQVKVQIDAKVAHFFTSKKHLSTQKIVEVLKNGSLIMTFEVNHDEDIDNLIKSWLPHIKVLEPIHFKNRIRKELMDYLEQEH